MRHSPILWESSHHAVQEHRNSCTKECSVYLRKRVKAAQQVLWTSTSLFLSPSYLSLFLSLVSTSLLLWLSPATGVDQSNYRVAKLIRRPGTGRAATSHQPLRQSAPNCFHLGPLVSFIMAIGANPTSKPPAGPPVTIVSALGCTLPSVGGLLQYQLMMEVSFLRWREKEREGDLINHIKLIRTGSKPPTFSFSMSRFLKMVTVALSFPYLYLSQAETTQS